jgi:hypothetical protein
MINRHMDNLIVMIFLPLYWAWTLLCSAQKALKPKFSNICMRDSIVGRSYEPPFLIDNILCSIHSMMWNFACMGFKHNIPTLFKKMINQVRDVNILMNVLHVGYSLISSSSLMPLDGQQLITNWVWQMMVLHLIPPHQWPRFHVEDMKSCMYMIAL